MEVSHSLNRPAPNSNIFISLLGAALLVFGNYAPDDPISAEGGTTSLNWQL